jgi:hypothetical protein
VVLEFRHCRSSPWPQYLGRSPGLSEEWSMSDFLYVALTVAVFAVLAAAVAGLERL